MEFEFRSAGGSTDTAVDEPDVKNDGEDGEAGRPDSKANKSSKAVKVRAKQEPLHESCSRRRAQTYSPELQANLVPLLERLQRRQTQRFDVVAVSLSPRCRVSATQAGSRSKASLRRSILPLIIVEAFHKLYMHSKPLRR